MKNNNISFVVLTRNSSSYILGCLKSISKNMQNGDELIIIDNNSSDTTITTIQSFIQTCNITVSFYKVSKNIGISEGRNFATKLAKNDYIAHIDSDIVLEDNAVSTARNKMLFCDALIGEYYDEGDGLNWLIEMNRELFAKKRQKDFEGPITFKKFATFSGGMCIIKKQVFIETNGYNTAYHGAPSEDINFEFELIKNKKKILIDKNFIGHHKKSKLTFKGLLKKGKYAGKGVAYLIKSSFKQKVLIPFNLQWPRLALYPLLFIIFLAIFKTWSLVSLGVLVILRMGSIVFSIKKKYSLYRLIKFEFLRFFYELSMILSTIIYLIFYWKNNKKDVENYEVIKLY